MPQRDRLAEAGGGYGELQVCRGDYEKIDNSAGSNGDKECRVWKEGEYEFVYNGGDATQALVGSEVYIVDDQTVDEDAAVTTNDIKCGVISEYISATKVRVRIDNYAR